MAERARLVCARAAVARAADLLAAALHAADGARGGARLAIPGGSALAALGPARAQLGSTWRRVRLTWVDERIVPLADARSNRGLAFRTGALDALDPPERLLPRLEDGERPSAAIARVAAALARDFGGTLDISLLGMGEDGHVASLFAGARDVGPARVAFVPARGGAPARLSLTRAMLASAASAVLLAMGEAKRAAIERVLAGDPALPATGLPGLVIVTDLDLGGSTAT